MGKKWRKQDETYLKRYAKKRTLAELAERFKVDPALVEGKLDELKLTTKDGKGHQEPWVDPALTDFEKGLRAFHAKKWEQARAAFERALADTDQTDLRARIQVYLESCRQHLEDEPQIEDPYLEAVVAKNRGDLEAALEICTRGGRRSKDGRFALLAAAVLALLERVDEAVEMLQQAIELEPENRVHAFHDPDFQILRGHEAFDALYQS